MTWLALTRYPSSPFASILLFTSGLKSLAFEDTHLAFGADLIFEVLLDYS